MVPLNPPLVPRNGRVLHVLFYVRISGDKQNELSLDDQIALLQQFLDAHYDGEVEIEVIREVGKGELRSRTWLDKLLSLIESGEYDLVLSEDGSRVYRRAQLIEFCEDCEDAGVRYITVKRDNIDTAHVWRTNALFAGMRAEMSNTDNSDRIIRSLDNRFVTGRVVAVLPYPYIKPHAHCAADEVTIADGGREVMSRWFTILEQGGSFADVADMLNKADVPTGKWCRLDKWDARMVARVTYNPILKGIRQRKQRKAKRINKSGKRITVKADPSEHLFDFRENLVVVDPERYDRIVAMLRKRNSRMGRKPKGHPDSRARKHTRWPGGSATCAVCGRKMVWGGHGRDRYMVCSGTRDYACWAALDMPGQLAAERAVLAIIDRLAETEWWPEALAEQMRREYDETLLESERRIASIEQKEAKLTQQSENLLLILADKPDNQVLRDRLDAIDAELKECQNERSALPAIPDAPPAIPPRDELITQAKELVGSLEFESREWGREMRRLVTMFEVYPVRLIDGGRIYLRARIEFDLSGLAGLEWLNDSDLLKVQTAIIDLFDPVERVRLLPEVLRLRSEGLTQYEVADQLNTHQATIWKVERLHAMLTEAGLNDPYVIVTEPPDDYRLKKHENPRYSFTSVEGHVPFWDADSPNETRDAA